MKFKIRALLDLIDDAINISKSGADWEVIYDMVFSPSISKMITHYSSELGLSLDYCDLDMDYSDDVLAYVNALSDLKEELEKIERVL